MPFLLDTCALSELVAKSPNRHAVDAILDLPRDDIFLSIITVGEIHRGIVGLPASARKSFLVSWFDEHVLGLYRPRTLLVDHAVSLRWGELKIELTRMRLVMAANDSLIAATALVHGLTVVTRNEKDFTPSGVKILNPWR